MQKALGALSGAVPGLGGSKSSRSFGRSKKSSSSGKGGKAGGVALLTAAAGFAFQNRDKLTSKLRRKGSDQGSTTGVPPVTGSAATNSPSVPPRG
jgi:hypothetical protein